MAVIGVTIFVLAGIVFGCILALGWEAASARQYLTRATILAREGKFEEARQAILVATRQAPELQVRSDVQVLYEMIEEKSIGKSVDDFDRLVSGVLQWPQTKWEKAIGGIPLRVAVVIVIAIEILLKLGTH